MGGGLAVAGVRVWSVWRTLPCWWLGARRTVLRLRAFGSGRTRSVSRRHLAPSSLLPPLSGAKAAGGRQLSPLPSLGTQPLRHRLRRVRLRSLAPSFGRVCQPAQPLRPRSKPPAQASAFNRQQGRSPLRSFRCGAVGLPFRGGLAYASGWRNYYSIAFNNQIVSINNSIVRGCHFVRSWQLNFVGFSSFYHRKKSPHTCVSRRRLCRLSPVKYYGGLSPFPLIAVAWVFPSVCWTSQPVAWRFVLPAPPPCPQPAGAAVCAHAVCGSGFSLSPSLAPCVFCRSGALRAASVFTLSPCRQARSRCVLGCGLHTHSAPPAALS